MNITYQLNNPFFNEFLFNAVLNASQELKNRLPIYLLKHTTNPAKIKAFADKASLEKKLEMLARLGASFSLTVSPPNYMSKEKLEEICDKYLKGNRIEGLDEMFQKNVFVQTDREIMAIHSLMAMNCHSETYMLNRDYALIAAQITQDKKINPRTADIELIKSVMQDYKMLCKFMLYNLTHQNFVDNGNGFNVKELLVLLYLYMHRTDYVKLKVIQQFFTTTYSPQVIIKTINGLCESFHVSKFPKEYRYSITGIGIQILSQYVNRLINQTLSY